MSGFCFARRVLAAVLFTVVTAGCGGSRHAATPQAIPVGPPGAAFYVPPQPVPAGAPGTVLRQRPIDPDSTRGVLKAAAGETLLMYRTTAQDGSPVLASGTVAVPPGAAPAGGWPVVAWDHGTTGIGTDCAPSRNLSPYLQGSGDMLDTLLRLGFAVVQPDYPGLGVTGVRHAYLVGKPAAYSTIDLVRAARALNPGIGRSFFVAGHSQGGHAALWAGDVAASYAPDLDLRGVVAVAPGNGFQRMPALVTQGDATAAPYLGIFLMMVDGMAAAYPSVHPAALLTPAGLAAADSLWGHCYADGPTGLPPADQIIRAGADTSALTAVLDANGPDRVRPAAPVFLVQGASDPLVVFNQGLAQTLCGKGAHVLYKSYPGEGHNPEEVHAAGADVVAWIRDRLAGRAMTGACAAG